MGIGRSERSIPYERLEPNGSPTRLDGAAHFAAQNHPSGAWETARLRPKRDAR